MVAIGRMSPKGARNGFTIVELLIVIVVIAILAAVSFVAYSGIQNKAADTAVKSDLSQASRKAMIEAAKEALSNTFIPSRNGSAAAHEAMSTIYRPSNVGYSSKERYPIIALYEDSRWHKNPDTNDWVNHGPGYVFYALSSSGEVYISNSWGGGATLAPSEGGVRDCLEMRLDEFSFDAVDEKCGGMMPIAFLEFLLGATHQEIVDFYIQQGGSPGYAAAAAQEIQDIGPETFQGFLEEMQTLLLSADNKVQWPFKVQRRDTNRIGISRLYVDVESNEEWWDTVYGGYAAWDSLEQRWIVDGSIYPV